MEIITKKSQMKKRIAEFKASGKSIGFVPTMGYLHDGHLALAKESVKENDMTIMSIFVNPLQFGPNEDFDSYPRDHERDAELAQDVGVTILFMPERSDIYDEEMTIDIVIGKQSEVLCGKRRPGHFNGVATILIKLFNIIQPTDVYFGLKDAQQVAIVDSLIKNFDFPIRLHPLPTIREDDGLAKSSRNVYLSISERQKASYLYKSLQKGKKAIIQGERNPVNVVNLIKQYLQDHLNEEIDYIDVFSFPNLEVLHKLEGKIIIALAVKFSKARLIDNIIVEISE